jgi:hypothetical protein
MDRCQVRHLGLPIGTLQYFKSIILMPMPIKVWVDQHGFLQKIALMSPERRYGFPRVMALHSMRDLSDAGCLSTTTSHGS